MSAIGTGDGLMPATYQLPDATELTDELSWFDSPTRWHLGNMRGLAVVAVCGVRFTGPARIIPRDSNPAAHVAMPLCMRCADYHSKEPQRDNTD